MRALAIAVTVFGIGCSSGGNGAGPSNDAGSTMHDATSVDGSFGASACAACVDKACAQQLSDCGSDAACAAWLACQRACPTDSAGNVAPSCEAGCAKPSAASSAMLAETYDSCRTSGPGASCAACGAREAAAPMDAAPDIPFINEQCTGAMADDSSACNYCKSTQCCQTLAALYGDQSDFESMAMCVLACPSDAGTAGVSCLQGCFQAHPTAVGVYAPFQACVNVNCRPSCETPVSPCDQCTDAHCRDEYALCEGDPDCFELLYCTTNTGGATATVQDCESTFPKGLTAYDTLATCLIGNCEGSCTQ